MCESKRASHIGWSCGSVLLDHRPPGQWERLFPCLREDEVDGLLEWDVFVSSPSQCAGTDVTGTAHPPRSDDPLSPRDEDRRDVVESSPQSSILGCSPQHGKRSFVTPMDGFSQASFLATPESCCLDSTNLCYSVYYYHRSATTCPAA